MAVGPLDSTSWERKDGRKVCTPTIGYAVPGYASSRTCVCVCVCVCVWLYVSRCTRVYVACLCCTVSERSFLRVPAYM